MLANVTDLLYRTGAAHGQYETTELGGVYDQAWAAWYAGWAIEHGLNDLLGTGYAQEELGRLLTSINEEHKRQSDGLNWAQFTARWLVKATQPEQA
jgi:hypothetical protein